MDPKYASKPPSPPPESYYTTQSSHDFRPPLPGRPPSAPADMDRVHGSPGAHDGFNGVSLPMHPKMGQSDPAGQPGQPGQPGRPPSAQYPPSSPYPPAPESMVEIAPQPTMSTAGSVVAGGRPGPSGLSGPPPRPPGGYSSDYYTNYSSYNTPPRPHSGLVQSPGPMYAGNDTLNMSSTSTTSKADLRAARAAVEQGLGRLIDLQRQQQQQLQYGPGAASVPNSTAAAVQEQLRLQSGSVVRDLRLVRRALAGMAKAAENHRFRRWLVGGLLAAFVPLVRRLFRRPPSAKRTGTTGTEYAFAKSRALVDRMLGSVQRRGGLASIAFFVFAVLYIFSNEVSLRVARTVGRRLKKLSSKIERGDEPLSEADVKQLAGWRWRVLLWGR